MAGGSKDSSTQSTTTTPSSGTTASQLPTSFYQQAAQYAGQQFTPYTPGAPRMPTPTLAYTPTVVRSNYDPARAQAMASQMYDYNRRGPQAINQGYADTIQAWQGMRQSQAAEKAAAEAKAKADAEAKARQNNWLASIMINGAGSEGNGQMMAGATGGLASLQGFKR